ncbi:MAG: transglutaminase domain-containing protein [Eubacterium sp.]|nr:transglutaminase domain-containing protein [Eubacterium sp.]
MKVRSWHKVLKEKENIEITNGIAIDKSVYDIKENRVHTLIIKGLITYCLSMGGAGIFLSALEIEYSELIVNLVALITALMCSFLYYNSLTENIGYLLYFGVFAVGAYFLRDYINSGFYAIVNDVMEAAAIYLNMDGLQHYSERIDDRYTAITITVLFFIMLINILINNYISRRARYLITAVIVMFLSIIPFYFECEPDTFYAVLLLGGIVMAYFLRAGRHYKLYRRSSVFYHDKNGLSYGMDHRSLRQVMLIGFIFVFLFVNITGMFVPKEGYDAKGNNKYKKDTMETVTNFFTLGIEGLFNYYANRGGLSTGRLGGVASVKLDYKTDITVEFTPYSYETLYLKQFVGNIYNPYQNSWTMNMDFRTPQGENHDTVELLKDAYEQGLPSTAKGKLKVTNVDATGTIYLPYYSDDTNNMVYYNTTVEYEYYPDMYLYDVSFYQKSYNPGIAYISPDCRRIPDENYDVIREFVVENSIEGESPEEVIDSLIEYFQDNVPYTIRPGATPRNRDFVNYFLKNNKKGYCAHFASAAALILRYFDIPTRYCEGYAISYDHATHYGDLVEDAKYSDYYDGYNALGETALISVDATDANAHAWVEAYIDGKGWVVVEATPSVDDEEELLGFWEQFSNSVGKSNDTDTEEDQGTGFRFRINDNAMQKAALIVIIAIAAAVMVFTFIFFRPTIVYVYKYAGAGRNDRLILKYMRFIRKEKRKDKDFRDKMNYETQLEYLRKSGKMTCTDDDAARLLNILNKAGFSKETLSEDDFSFAEGLLYK